MNFSYFYSTPFYRSSDILKYEVKKGKIRSFILFIGKFIRECLPELEKAREIKTEELEEFKGTEKAGILKKQISIIKEITSLLKDTLSKVEDYKELTTT